MALGCGGDPQGDVMKRAVVQCGCGERTPLPSKPFGTMECPGCGVDIEWIHPKWRDGMTLWVEVDTTP